MTGLILIGGGGHCRSCIDVVEAESKYSVCGIVDREVTADTDLLGYPYLGDDSRLPDLLEDVGTALITVGHIKSAGARKRLYARAKSLGAILPSITSPFAHVSRHGGIGEGTVAFHGAIVNARAFVARNCIVNSRALVEHDSIVGDHCHISTGAVINGNCNVGAETFIGSGAVVYHGVNIGTGCVIAAGTSVKSDVPDGTLFRGAQ